MPQDLIWRSDVLDWEKISVDAYKFVLEQGKEPLNEVIEESHAITRRAMTILLSYIAALSGVLGYFFSDRSKLQKGTIITILIVSAIAILTIYAFSLLIRLIYPKELFYKGSPPKEIFFKDVFNELTELEGLKSVLFDEVIRTQYKIERMEESNTRRIALYRRTMRISLLFISVSIIIIVKTIFTWS